MPAKIGEGVMDVVFDQNQIQRAAQQQLIPSAGRIAADFASAFVGVKLLDFGKQGLEELKSAQEAQSNVEAVIRSTGGAADVTAEHVDELASSQLKLTGVDDEVIKQGAAKLLTFKQVANQVGEGNDVFDRATKLSLDLAQLGFGSVESASVLLGKALNDPVKGLTALQRVGVALTDSQKAQVKAFVASGDVLSAQKVILKEVESQVGGAAEAYGQTLPGKVAIAQQSLENMKGELVAGAAPALEFGAQAVSALTDKFEELPDGAKTAVGGVVLLGGGIAALARPVGDIVRLYDAWRAAQLAKVASDEAEAVAEAAKTGVVQASVAAMAGVDAAATRRVVSNEALTFSENEVLAAQARRILGVDAVIAADDALQAANYATVASEEALAVASGAAGAALGPIGLIGVAVTAGAALLGVSTIFGDNSHQAQNAAAEVNAYTQALKENSVAATDRATLDILVGPNAPAELTDVAQSLHDAHIELTGFFEDVRNNHSAFGDLGSDLAGLKSAAITGDVKDLGRILGDAAAKGDTFAASLIAARNAGTLTDEQIIRILNGVVELSGSYDTARGKQDLLNAGVRTLGTNADGAAGSIDGLNGAAMEGPDDTKAKALATWYDAIRKNADAAFAAALKLAPADVRARQGQLAIADANDKVKDAETKLANLRKMGTPEQIADAERDLEKARLDQESAVYQEADALAELANQQQIAATGTAMNAEQTENFTQGALALLNSQLTGPTHEALAVHIFDLAVAANKARELREAELFLSGGGPAPSLSVPGGGSESGPRPATGRDPVRRATGGPIGPGQVFRGAEQGWEVLLRDGMYQAPPRGGTVLNHNDSERFMAARGGGITQHIAVDMTGYSDAATATRHLPDELRAAGFLAAVN